MIEMRFALLLVNKLSCICERGDGVGGTKNTISEERGLNPENRRFELNDEIIKSI